MAKKQERIPKTLYGKLSDLDDHVFLLRNCLNGMRDDLVHLKALSAELRTLVCYSSNTEGLLWRLAEELNISDHVYIYPPGNLDTTQLLAYGTTFFFLPIARAGFGHPALQPEFVSLRAVIKEAEAVFVAGKILTHEYLIKAIAQQMGTAHEDDGIEIALAQMNQIFLNGIQPYVQILATDASLVLEVAERLLDHAIAISIYQRKNRISPHGSLTIIVRLGLLKSVDKRTRVLSFHSPVAAVEFTLTVCPEGWIYSSQKNENSMPEMISPFRDDWAPNAEYSLAIAYDSNTQKARLMTAHSPLEAPVAWKLGWVDSNDFLPPTSFPEREGLVYLQALATFSRLITSDEVRQFATMSLDLHEQSCEPDSEISPFPD